MGNKYEASLIYGFECELVPIHDGDKPSSKIMIQGNEIATVEYEDDPSTAVMDLNVECMGSGWHRDGKMWIGNRSKPAYIDNGELLPVEISDELKASVDKIGQQIGLTPAWLLAISVT